MSSPLLRRKFLQLGTGTALAGLLPSRGSAASDASTLYRRVVPAKKNLSPGWTSSLVQRGASLDSPVRADDKQNLSRIGMTVGGIACGTVYLSGDGRLYIWDIFHQAHEGVVPNRTPVPPGMENIGPKNRGIRERDGANYVAPPTADNQPNPFHVGFSLDLDGSGPRSLDASGWSKVSFSGRWPLGIVDYADPDCPLTARLHAWTPFIPLSLADSSLPVTVMEYTLENRSNHSVDAALTGRWENPVWCLSRRGNPNLKPSSTAHVDKDPAMILHGAEAEEGSAAREAADFGTAALALLGHDGPRTDHGKDSISARFTLPSGASITVRFLLAWHFPNAPKLPGIGRETPHFALRFQDAATVIRDVAQRFESLRGHTMKWVDVWNNSTLPQWLLDRSILTTNTLQTTNCHILGNRHRFWAWEGVGCCPGTCGHVWHYAQGVAFLFPEIERNLRELTDFAVAMNPDGSIRFRAEAADTIAIDSQTTYLLRTLREHRNSPDHAFLKRVWPQAKRALQWLIRFDEDGRGGLDGLLDGMQHNTLDAEWYGKIHCLCSLYLAALRAGAEMARLMADESFSKECERVHSLGAERIAGLFNGEFYTQEIDPAHASAIGVGDGCYIDQVIGQWWADLTGLGRLYDTSQIRSALHSLWKYNFVPEMGAFRKAFPKGRFYALPGEAGLLMCTWPKGGLREDFKKHWQYGYFNECMSGFEWQAAAHMIGEGSPVSDIDVRTAPGLLEDSSDPRSLTLRGLAVARAIHDRYHPSKRNPYNEIECSDHYARANASYSVFLAACGFGYDGPAGRIAFAPKINPEQFRAAFTSAEGWGTFEQQAGPGHSWSARLSISHGSLTLREVRLPWITAKTTATRGPSAIASIAGPGVIRFSEPLILQADGPALSLQGT